MKLHSLALILVLSTSARGQIGAVWTSPTTGALGASTFDTTGFGSPYLNSFDLSGGSFAGAPLASSQESVEINAYSNWTINFSPPVANLRIYCIYWRGLNGQAGPTGSAGPSDYTFDHTPTVLSGLVNATLAGMTMTCPDGYFHNGILEFSGPISSLSCTTTATQGHFHALTFGTELVPNVGTTYCSPAVVNSTGSPGSLSATGSAVAAANNLTLEASSLPLNSFGFFLTSATQGFTANPGGSQGNLCLGGSIGRYVGQGQIKNSGTTGRFSLALDLPQTPTPTGFVPVLAGQTRNFQSWHRDSVSGVATSNFTDALSIVFQ